MSADRSAASDGPWDVIVVGSGFGGSVSALRLVERGYRVLLLEKGPRYAPEDFPETNWQLRRWLWAPRLGLRGPFRMTFLRHVTALSGIGVGGGSLVYANTLSEPGEAFFDAPSWRDLADWSEELAPHYRTARRMLGATSTRAHTRADEVLAGAGRRRGRGEAPEPVDVGVYFGDAGVTVVDPYFGGEGPARTGCIECGGCMLGCRHGAKNTLDLNYLHLAERKGLTLLPEHEVTWVRPAPDGRDATSPDRWRYEVEALAGREGWLHRRRRRTFRARSVVFAAGVLGTVPLLLRLRASEDGLPALSPRVGDFVRTNSEVLVGVVGPDDPRPMSDGVAITSAMETAEGATLEPVRYPRGSGFFRLLMAPHAPGATLTARLGAAVRRLARDPLGFARALFAPGHARRTLILLYMRTLDGHLSLRRGRTRLGITSTLVDGPPPAASFPEATALADAVAEETGGFPASLLTETLTGTPTTAHILGGAVMGASPEDGVVDSDHRVWGYPGLWVVDGSAVSANPGVNPSLTITALAERAMERFGL